MLFLFEYINSIIEAFELCDIFPSVVCRYSEFLKNDLNLIKVRSPTEQRIPNEHFSYEASNGPNIYNFCVLFLFQQKLWRPVPPGHNSHCEILTIDFLKASSETKISYFEDAILC